MILRPEVIHLPVVNHVSEFCSLNHIPSSQKKPFSLGKQNSSVTLYLAETTTGKVGHSLTDRETIELHQSTTFTDTSTDFGDRKLLRHCHKTFQHAPVLGNN